MTTTSPTNMANLATNQRFSRLVLSARAQGIGLDGAVDAARRAMGLTADEIPSDEQRDEKAEQAEVMKLFRAHGFIVRSTSQARASKVAPGLPDLIVFHPTRGIAFFFETKRAAGGKLSPAQIAFRDDCLACGWDWATGDYRAARSKLIALGFAQAGAG